MENRITKILGIKYPIICGGMALIGTAELAAAVSNAGGLGQISAGDSKEFCKREIERTRKMTDKPFAVNIPLMTTRWEPEIHIQAVIEEKVPIVSTSGADPMLYTARLRAAGIVVMHTTASVRQAKRAEAAGVDIIVTAGSEAGGACGYDDVSTLVLVPQVVDAVTKTPVVAAGGICDARGYVAAFVLGAEGIQMGTAFLASKESIAHPAFKKRIIEAKDTDTMLTGRTVGPLRCLKNKMTEEASKLEYSGAAREIMLEFFGMGRSRKGEIEGDVENGTLIAGEVSSMLHSIRSCKEIIDSIVNNKGNVVKRLNTVI